MIIYVYMCVNYLFIFLKLFAFFLKNYLNI